MPVRVIFGNFGNCYLFGDFEVILVNYYVTNGIRSFGYTTQFSGTTEVHIVLLCYMLYSSYPFTSNKRKITLDVDIPIYLF